MINDFNYEYSNQKLYLFKLKQSNLLILIKSAGTPLLGGFEKNRVKLRKFTNNKYSRNLKVLVKVLGKFY